MSSTLQVVARRSVVVTALTLFALATAPARSQLQPDARPAAAGQPGEAPAAPTAVHANHEHPAVTAWRLAQDKPQPMDPNFMLVQPPASVTWTVQPETARPPTQRMARR